MEQAFREYYPPSGPVISLECAWESDKFVLLERQYFSNGEESHLEIDVPDMPDVRYEVVGFGSEGYPSPFTFSLQIYCISTCFKSHWFSFRLFGGHFL